MFGGLFFLALLIVRANGFNSLISRFNHPTSIFPRLSCRIATLLQSAKDNVSFGYLKSFDAKCVRLSDRESEFLSSFYNLDLKCFQIYPFLNSQRISVTTTCIIINAILANPEHWEGTCRWDTNPDHQISLKEVTQAIKETEWSFDAFQTPIIVSTLCKMKCAESDSPKFIQAVECLLEQRSKLSLHRKQTNSAYIRYKTSRALLDLVENKAVPASFVGTHKIGFALERSNMVAFDELCRQLAFYNSGDLSNFDVIILVFSLLGYYETSKSIFLTSFARGVVQATNMKLIKSALDIIFSVQSEDGTWRKGEPIFTQSDRGSNRDIGNSYVFFFDMIGSLLGPLADSEPSLLAPYLPQLERYTARIDEM